MKKFLFLGILILLISCEESIRTTDATESYRYWSGNNPPKEIKLINGEYYQTPHFTLEYQFFLQFKSDENWFYDFVEYNNLEIDTIKNDWQSTVNLPNWFNPNKDFIIYSKNKHDEFDRSRYFINPENGMCFIFETFGM